MNIQFSFASVFFFLITTSLGAQTISISLNPETNYSYSKVFDLDSISKESLHLRINEWIALRFNSPSEVIKFSNKEEGKLILKPVINQTLFFDYKNVNAPVNTTITYNLTLLQKNNKYKVDINNIWVSSAGIENPLETYSTDLNKIMSKLIKDGVSEKEAHVLSISQQKYNLSLHRNLENNLTELIKSLHVFISNNTKDDW
jgi:hypothetical protein